MSYLGNDREMEILRATVLVTKGQSKVSVIKIIFYFLKSVFSFVLKDFTQETIRSSVIISSRKEFVLKLTFD